jgi:spoIIIJ-associated protein
MQTVESATEILDTMLGHLGFAAKIDPHETPDGPCLQISSGETRKIIGKDGERLDDLQYLVNRILRRRDPKAPRVKVDCEHFREIQEEKMKDELRVIAERVKLTSRPFQMRPLNAYYRRMVYNILADDTDISCHSPEGDDRLKRITISNKIPPTSKL